MYLRTNPLTNLTELHSSFFQQQIEMDRFALTACREQIFLEHIKRGFLPETRRIHVIPRESQIRVISGPFQSSRPTGDGGFELVDLRRLPLAADGSPRQYFELTTRQRDQFLVMLRHFELQFQNGGDRHGIGGIGYITFLVRFLEQSGMAKRVSS